MWRGSPRRSSKTSQLEKFRGRQREPSPQCLIGFELCRCRKCQARRSRPRSPQVSVVVLLSFGGIWVRVVPGRGALGEADGGVAGLWAGCLRHGRVDAGQTSHSGRSERWDRLLQTVCDYKECVRHGWPSSFTSRLSLPRITAINSWIKVKYGSSSHLKHFRWANHSQ